MRSEGIISYYGNREGGDNLPFQKKIFTTMGFPKKQTTPKNGPSPLTKAPIIGKSIGHLLCCCYRASGRWRRMRLSTRERYGAAYRV